MNTTVTIQFSNGETREFTATDQLEEMIQQGHMFSVTTLHPDEGHDTELKVSKMFVGNPVAALGNMVILRDQIDAQNLHDHLKQAALAGVDACIEHLSAEITSHQSGMTPLEKH